MSFGGARSWLDQRGSSSSRLHELGESDSYDDYDTFDVPDEWKEVPVEDQAAQLKRRQVPPTAAASPQLASNAVIMNESMYRACKDIFSPSNEVKTRTGDVLLKRQDGKFHQYSGIDLDTEALEAAGHMPASLNQTLTDRLHFAEKLTEVACRHRCGGAECNDHCRVRAFVVAEGHGTDFFFGTYEDVVQSINNSCACEVHIWDGMKEDSMLRLRQTLDSLLTTAPGLAMQTTELKTVPGQARDVLTD
jgi:hypothetical protein